MFVSTSYLRLEKLTFVYQSLPSDEPESELSGLPLNLQEIKEIEYDCLTAEHHADYGGRGTGEMFFPMETGEYDRSTNMERDNGGRP
jgi:hypothetical protein